MQKSGVVTLGTRTNISNNYNELSTHTISKACIWFSMLISSERKSNIIVADQSIALVRSLHHSPSPSALI